MLVKVLLLSHDASLLNLERLCILEFHLRSFLENHVDDSVKVVINLRHDLNLAFLHILTQLGALGDQELRSPTQ